MRRFPSVLNLGCGFINTKAFEAMLDKLVVLLLLGLAQAEISVHYLVEYNEDNGECGGTNLTPVTINMPYFSKALNVMESAVSMGVEYEFVITFSKDEYVVDVLNATTAKDPCYWVLHVLSPDAQELSSKIRLSSYYVGDNYSVVLRYEKIPLNTYNIIYTIEYPQPFCTNNTAPSIITVNIRKGSTALNVMELAVQEYGSSYSFSATYTDNDYGYSIIQINNVKISSACMWVAFVHPAGGAESMLDTSVSKYIIPAEGHTLTLRYMEVIVPTTVPATTSGSKGSRYGATAFLIILCGILLAV